MDARRKGDDSCEEGKKRGGSPGENEGGDKGRLQREEERKREKESERTFFWACQEAVEEDCIKKDAVHRHGSLDRATKTVASKYRVPAA